MIIFNPVTAETSVHGASTHSGARVLGRDVVGAASRWFRSDCVVIDIILLQPELTNWPLRQSAHFGRVFFYEFALGRRIRGLVRDQSSVRVMSRGWFCRADFNAPCVRVLTWLPVDVDRSRSSTEYVVHSSALHTDVAFHRRFPASTGNAVCIITVSMDCSWQSRSFLCIP